MGAGTATSAQSASSLCVSSQWMSGVRHGTGSGEEADGTLTVDNIGLGGGDFADAGASYITFHPEASPHIDRTLQLIRSTGCKSGLVFNPATPLDCLEYADDGRAPGFSESENASPALRYALSLAVELQGERGGSLSISRSQ